MKGGYGDGPKRSTSAAEGAAEDVEAAAAPIESWKLWGWAVVLTLSR